MRGPHTENYSFFALERRQPLRTFFFSRRRLQYKKKNKWKIQSVFDLERVNILEAQKIYIRIYFFPLHLSTETVAVYGSPGPRRSAEQSYDSAR